MSDLTPLHPADRDQRTRWLSEVQDRQLRRDLTQLPELVALVATFGAVGLAVWAVQMLWIPFWAAGVVNGLVGAALAVWGERAGWPALWATWLPIVLCFALRFVSLRLAWNLPRFGRRDE